MKTPQICIVSQRVEAVRGWTSRKDLFLLAFRDWPLRIIFHSPFSHKRLSLSFSHKRILRNRNQIHSFAYIKSFIHKAALWTYEIKVSLVYRNKKAWDNKILLWSQWVVYFWKKKYNSNENVRVVATLCSAPGLTAFILFDFLSFVYLAKRYRLFPLVNIPLPTFQ